MISDVRLMRGRRPATLTLEAFGVRVGLDVEEPELAAAVAEMLPAVWRRSGAGDAARRFGLAKRLEGGYQMAIDGVPGGQYATLEVALGMLESSIEQFTAAAASGWLFIHAGAVAHGGKALVIPGQSFTGKSTLVAALVAAGATYYSDEFAVLDREGRLHAYPRRLSMRTANGQPGEQRHARELGDLGAWQPVEIGVVAVTQYRPGATWRPNRLSPAQGLAAMFASTLAGDERPAESMHTLRRAVDGATVLEGERGEARAIAAELLETLSQ